jgi:hypothetical protein
VIHERDGEIKRLQDIEEQRNAAQAAEEQMFTQKEELQNNLQTASAYI